PAHVLLAHVDDALEAEPRTDGRGRNPVLAGSRLRDDPPLAEPTGEDRLAERVVQLMGAGVEQVLPLEIDPLARRESFRERERSRPPAVRLAQLVELRLEGRIRERLAPAAVELLEPRDQ